MGKPPKEYRIIGGLGLIFTLAAVGLIRWIGTNPTPDQAIPVAVACILGVFGGSFLIIWMIESFSS